MENFAIHRSGRSHWSQAGLKCVAKLLLPGILLGMGMGTAGWAQTNCAPVPAGLVGWWAAEGDATDISGAHDGSFPFGSAFAGGVVGQAFDFNGSSRRVSIPDGPAFHLTNAMTLEAWVYPRAYGGFITFRGDNRGGLDNWTLDTYESGFVKFTLMDLANNVVSVRAALALNQWQHVAATWERASGDLKIYVGGALAAQTNSSLVPIGALNPAYEPAIGVGNHGGTFHQFPFNGLIDELGIYNQALTAAQIAAIHASGTAGKCMNTPTNPPSGNCVTIPTGLASWWRGEHNAVDELGTNSGVLIGGTRYNAGRVGQAFEFDGVDDGVVIPDAPDLNVGAGQDFSVEAWIQAQPHATDYGVMSILSKRIAPTLVNAQGFELALHYGKLGGQLADERQQINNFISAGPDLLDGLFHHVAMVVNRSATNGGRFYVDGQEVMVFDPTVQPGDLSTSAPFRIGRHASDWFTGSFRGVVDEAAFYRRALSANEVTAIYLASSAGKCPATNATAPFLLNVDFGAGLTGSDKTGFAAIGQTTNDFWNYYTRDDGAGGWRTFGVLPNLKTAAGTATAAGLVVANAPGAWGNGSPDPMYDDYIYPFNGGEVAVTLTNLPPGQYDVLACASDGNFEISAGGVSYGVQTTQDATPVNPPLWTVGRQYARFTNIVVGNGQPLVMTVRPGSGGYAVISGMQIVSSGGTNAGPETTCIASPAGLVSWWRGENNFADSANGHQGSAVGTVGFVPGKVGTGFSFDGNSHIVIPHHPALNNSNALTIELWYLSTQSNNVYYGILDKRVGTTGANYGINVAAQHGLGVYFDDPTVTDGDDTMHGSSFETSRLIPAPPAGIFHHLAATFAQINSNQVQLETYVNGQQVRTKIISGNLANTLNTMPVTIGATAQGAGEFFQGIIDEVAIYNRVLTASEITAIYTAGSAGKCASTNPPGLAPQITQQPQAVTVAANANAQFTVAASGIPAPTYQWFFHTNALAGQTTATLQLNNVQPQQAGDYFVLVSNPSGSITSSVATLTVLTYPPTITKQPTNLTVIEGGTASFSVQANGTTPLSYQWFFQDQPMTGKTSPTLTLTAVQSSNAGSYFVMVGNPYGSVTSAPALLNVIPKPACVPLHDGLVSWWRGETNSLDGWGDNHGNLSRSYVAGKVGWAFSSPGITVADSASLTVTNELTIETWVNPTSLHGGLSVVPLLVRSPQFPPGGAGFSSSYLLGLTNQNRLVFSVGTTSLVSTQAIPVNVWTHVAASYSGATGLRLFINGQLVSDRAYNAGIPSFPGNLYIGASGIQGGVFGVFPGRLDEVSLYRRALSAAEIQAIFAADLTGKCLAAPEITQQPQDQAVPLGEDVKLTTLVVGSRPLKYQWHHNGAAIPGATNAVLVLEKLKTHQAGFYHLSVTNSVGFDTSVRAEISLLPAPACTTTPPGLISWWPGDGNAGDAMGSNHIALYVPMLYPTGKVGSAFFLKDAASRITVNNSPSLNFGSNANFTIEMWIKTTNNPLPQPNQSYPNVPLFEKRTTTTTGWVGYSLSLNQGRLAFAMGSPGTAAPGVVSNYISSGPDLRDTMFHHIAVTVNRSATNGGVLYVDGLPVLTFNPQPHNGALLTTTPLYIGTPTVTISNSPFVGLIDEPALYNRDLTAAEIMALRQAGAVGKCRFAPQIELQPVSQVVNLLSTGQPTNAIISVGATGSPLLRYQWFRNGGPLPPQLGGDKATLVISNVQSFNGGTYWVRVTNLFGSVQSSNVQLTINQQPWIVPQNRITMEDQPVSVFLQSIDPNQNPLTYTIVAPPTNGTLMGTAPLLNYQPAPNFSGLDSFTVKVNDGYIDSTNTTIFIQVRPVNDAPVAYSQMIATDEDVPVSITLNVSDAENDPLTFQITPPTHGTLSGTPPHLIYTPAENYFGDDLFTYTATDSSNAVSQLAAVNLTIRPVNDAPTAVIEVSPLDELPGITNHVLIAPACCPATLRLDAAQSTDVEGTSLSYAWVVGTNVIGSAQLITNLFLPGSLEIQLLVSDDTNVSTATEIVEIITPGEAVAFLKSLVTAGISEPRQRMALLNWLRQADEAFAHCRVEQGVRFLEMFRRRVAERTTGSDPDLAQTLTETAAAIIEAAPDCDPCHRLNRPKHKRDRHDRRDHNENQRDQRAERAEQSVELEMRARTNPSSTGMLPPAPPMRR